MWQVLTSLDSVTNVLQLLDGRSLAAEHISAYTAPKAGDELTTDVVSTVQHPTH